MNLLNLLRLPVDDYERLRREISAHGGDGCVSERGLTVSKNGKTVTFTGSQTGARQALAFLRESRKKR